MINKLNLMDVFYFILNPTWRQTKIPKENNEEEEKKNIIFLSPVKFIIIWHCWIETTWFVGLN